MAQKKKAAPILGRPLIRANQKVGLELEVREVAKAAVELADLAASIDQTLNTRPSWVRFWVNVQTHGLAWLTPSATGGEFGAVRHLNGNFMVLWMAFGFHRFVSRLLWYWSRGSDGGASGLQNLVSIQVAVSKPVVR